MVTMPRKSEMLTFISSLELYFLNWSVMHLWIDCWHFFCPFLDIPCATDVSVERTTHSSIAFHWSSSSPDLSFRTTVCMQSSSTCSQGICSNCFSYNATNLMPNTGYNITVDSFTTLLYSWRLFQQDMLIKYKNSCYLWVGVMTLFVTGVCSTYIPLRDEEKGLLLFMVM